jgi:hypothetical protein
MRWTKQSDVFATKGSQPRIGQRISMLAAEGQRQQGRRVQEPGASLQKHTLLPPQAVCSGDRTDRASHSSRKLYTAVIRNFNRCSSVCRHRLDRIRHISTVMISEHLRRLTECHHSYLLTAALSSDGCILGNLTVGCELESAWLYPTRKCRVCVARPRMSSSNTKQDELRSNGLRTWNNERGLFEEVDDTVVPLLGQEYRKK